MNALDTLLDTLPWWASWKTMETFHNYLCGKCRGSWLRRSDIPTPTCCGTVTLVSSVDYNPSEDWMFRRGWITAEEYRRAVGVNV